MIENTDISKKIRDDHHTIKTELNSLINLVTREITKENYSRWREGLYTTLLHFNTDLHDHFDLEENGGFLQDILDIAPHKSHDVDTIKNEHRLIIGDLELVINAVNKAHTYKSSEHKHITQKINNLVSTLIKHEAVENSLLENTYLQDEGMGD